MNVWLVYVQASQIASIFSLVVARRAKLLPKDRALARLLLEAPALPEPLVPDLLRSLFLEGGEHATLALIATRDIMAQRPAIRLQALQVILSAAVAQDGDVRSVPWHLVRVEFGCNACNSP